MTVVVVVVVVVEEEEEKRRREDEMLGIRHVKERAPAMHVSLTQG